MTPAGAAMSGLDYVVRNSPIPNTVEGAFADARDFLENYEIRGREGGSGRSPGRQRGPGTRSQLAPGALFSEPKKKRKRSKYQMEFGRQLKKLKKAHPRTSIGVLMKRAHRNTKRALK